MLESPASVRQSSTGAYILEIRLRQPVRLRVGALGRVTLADGVYLYVGSARRDLDGRINRHCHLAKNKKGGGRWHVDYLLRHSAVHIAAVGRFPGQNECDLSKAVANLEGVTAPIRGFGSTDCRNGCAAHLYDVTSLTLAQLSEIFRQPFAADSAA